MLQRTDNLYIWSKKMKASQLKEKFLKEEYDELISNLYEDSSLVQYQKNRYAQALSRFMDLYGDQEVSIYSAAGRSEISGNHTDHQHGCVLAGSVNLDAIGIVTKQEGKIKIVSDDFDLHEIELDDLEKKEAEIGTSEALVRGFLRD